MRSPGEPAIATRRPPLAPPSALSVSRSGVSTRRHSASAIDDMDLSAANDEFLFRLRLVLPESLGPVHGHRIDAAARSVNVYYRC